MLRLLGIANGQLFSWLPTISLRCLGLHSLFSQLLAITFVPPCIAGAMLAFSYYKYRSVRNWLPYVLIFSFVVSPFCTTLGFRILKGCDCFAGSDGSELCFSYADYTLQCPSKLPTIALCNASANTTWDLDDALANTTSYPTGAGVANTTSLSSMLQPCASVSSGSDDDMYNQYYRTRSLALATVTLYAVVCPIQYALALFSIRRAIWYGPPTAWSASLGFLVREYERKFFWWELAMMAEKILLVGVLSIVSPGSLLQLCLAILVTLLFFTAGALARPYKDRAHQTIMILLSASKML
eukprot:7377016-Prymnesium_polylepis.1